MVKSIISISIVFTLLICGAFLEQRALNRDFKNFEKILFELYEKTEAENCDKEDAISVQKWWLEKKRSLHTYIPHSEIKEIDNWLSEVIGLIYTKSYSQALAKIEVLIEICENVPGAFKLRIENIF